MPAFKPARPKSEPRTVTHATVAGRDLPLSNLGKKLFPDGFTKAQLIDYYVKIAPFLLPHLSGRALTLKRYPHGSDREFFYEKQCPSFRPPWVPTMTVERESRKKTGVIRYCTVEDLPTLVWVANLASIELHVLLSKKEAIGRPTAVAFDLDPGAPAGILDCCEIGLRLKSMLDSLGLQSFPKTSGGKGLHIYVPLNTPCTFDDTKGFARAVATALERHDPARVTSNMAKAGRTGKIFVDWSQNDAHKTTVCVYSVRARESASVSTPVEWSEVESALKKRDPKRLRFEAAEAVARAVKRGDLFAPVLKLKQRLPGGGPARIDKRVPRG